MRTPLNEYLGLLATYLRPQWRQALLLGLILLAGLSLELLTPQILRVFIDTAAAGQSLATLTRLALLFLGASLAAQLATVGETYLAANVGLTATNRLRADLTLHCLQLDLPFHNAHTPGELIERVDGDVATLGNFFSRFVVHLLGNALLLIGVLVLLFVIDWRVGLAMTLFAFISLVAINSLRDVAVPYWAAARQASAELFGFLEERLSGTEDIRANGAVPYVMRRLFERSRALLRRELSAGLMSSATGSSTIVLFAAGMATGLGLGAYLYLAGAVTLGTIYLIYNYSVLLSRPIEQITRQIQDLQQAGASLGRIRGLLAERSAIEDGQRLLPAGPLSVEFQDVSFGYEPDEPILHDISLTLPRGSTLGLLGRTGSGKTSLTRLLFRLYDPTCGSVRLGGLDLRDVRLDQLRGRIGIVTQSIHLFHASVRDNLTFFEPGIPDERILGVLEQLGLWDWYLSLPDGLNTKLAPGGGGLSAGQAQLLAFTRVFLMDPGLVILDEASSRLDPATEQRLERAVDQLLAGRTAIIIAHRLATIQRTQTIIILEGGRCVESGPRDALARNPASRLAGLLRTGLDAEGRVLA